MTKSLAPLILPLAGDGGPAQRDRMRDRDCGMTFRRQVPIGPSIADFACLPAKLVVACDVADAADTKGK